NDAAAVFRQLGLHPGPDAALAAVASLAGAPPARVRALLDELARAGLVHQPRPRRYALHDLLRAYAVERTESQDTASERHAAVRRMVEHYVELTRANALQAAMFWPLTADEPTGAG